MPEKRLARLISQGQAGNISGSNPRHRASKRASGFYFCRSRYLSMGNILIILVLIMLTVGGIYAWKRFERAREKRLLEREYKTAVALWYFARDVKNEFSDMLRQKVDVLDFRKITVPHSQGYRVLIEFIGFNFRIHALPEPYGRGGRLSFFIDNSLTLRAADHKGERAAEQDEEYTGDFTS